MKILRQLAIGFTVFMLLILPEPLNYLMRADLIIYLITDDGPQPENAKFFSRII